MPPIAHTDTTSGAKSVSGSPSRRWLARSMPQPLARRAAAVTWWSCPVPVEDAAHVRLRRIVRRVVEGRCRREDRHVVTGFPPALDGVVARQLVPADRMRRIEVGQDEDLHASPVGRSYAPRPSPRPRLQPQVLGLLVVSATSRASCGASPSRPRSRAATATSPGARGAAGRRGSLFGDPRRRPAGRRIAATPEALPTWRTTASGVNQISQPASRARQHQSRSSAYMNSDSSSRRSPSSAARRSSRPHRPPSRRRAPRRAAGAARRSCAGPTGAAVAQRREAASAD